MSDVRWKLAPLIAAGVVALASAPGLAQSQGTAQGSPGTEGTPVIIEDRPAPDAGEDQRIIPEENAFVQIRGRWASDRSACATVDEGGGSGLYVTDTLIRWEGATCSIREVDVENGAATVYAFCATGSGRRDRTFELETSGEDRMTLSFLADGEQQEVSLQRCEEAQ